MVSTVMAWSNSMVMFSVSPHFVGAVDQPALTRVTTGMGWATLMAMVSVSVWLPPLRTKPKVVAGDLHRRRAVVASGGAEDQTVEREVDIGQCAFESHGAVGGAAADDERW